MGSREESEEEAPRENIGAQNLEENTKQMVTVTVTDPGEVEMGTTGGDSGVVSDFLISKKEVKWCWALLGLRIAAFVFCLIAFSVLAADEQKVLVEIPVQAYTYDYTVQMPYSFYWYHSAEFKYCFSANVVGFMYSVFQICDLLTCLITKNTQNPKLKGYFTIAMDQVLAYVLMSASTSAATASHLFRNYWAVLGGHEFTEMANASVILSFLAFVAFALASLVSSFILNRFSK